MEKPILNTQQDIFNNLKPSSLEKPEDLSCSSILAGSIQPA